MINRAILHLSLIFLFAFTQMGVATHEINHLENNQEHQQKDKNHPQNQCDQCLAYNHAASAGLAYSFVLPSITAEHILFAAEPNSLTLSSTSFYSARAPPITS